MYLLIENAGVCPLEGFTILGLSSSRSKEDKIGEFGSGNKHAINVLLRHDLPPRIYLGTKKLEFVTEPDTFEGETYHKVLYRLGGKRPVETGFCLEFGVRDWKDVHMGLREIVSNAIDRAGIENVNIEVTDKVRARSGYTRIYVPLSSDVKDFHQNLGTYFLHFSGRQNEKLLPKMDSSPAKIYRKGVFVREVDAQRGPSIFDYNFDDKFSIDEARNASDSTVVYEAAKAVASNEDALKKIFNHFKNKSRLGYWEFSFREFDLTMYSYVNKPIWQKAWASVFGNTTVTRDEYVHEMARRKGLHSVFIDSTWAGAIITHGIKDTSSLFSNVETNGYKIITATPTSVNLLNQIWSVMEQMSLTNGKAKPSLSCFSRVVEGNSMLFGYYQDDCIYINIDEDGNMQTMLEEVAHHITGSTDLSRDFQDFAFQVATRLIKESVA